MLTNFTLVLFKNIYVNDIMTISCFGILLE